MCKINIYSFDFRPMDELMKEIEKSNEPKLEKFDETFFDQDENLELRDDAVDENLEGRKKKRKKKKNSSTLRKAKKMVFEFGRLIQALKRVESKTKEMLIIFGTTVVHPKETFIISWDSKKVIKKMEEMSVDTMKRVDKSEMKMEMNELGVDRNSSEINRNRMSNNCGVFDLGNLEKKMIRNLVMEEQLFDLKSSGNTNVRLFK